MVDPEEDSEDPDDRRQESEEGFGKSVKRFLWELFFFLFALIIIGTIILATDFNGARTELRRMCMTDSGDGSSGDSHYTRIHVKHYILVALDFFDHGGTGTTTRINPHAFKRRNVSGTDPEREAFEKKSQEYSDPANLPPPPPEVKDLNLSPGKPNPAKPEIKSVPEKMNPAL